MISSVSSINFKGETVAPNAQDLINSPGKYAATEAPKAETQADSFEKGAEQEEGKAKKSKAGAVIGSLVGLLALAYVGLSVAVAKNKLANADVAEGATKTFMNKAQDFFYSVGKSGKELWEKIASKFKGTNPSDANNVDA